MFRKRLSNLCDPDRPEICLLPPITPPYTSSPCKALIYKWTFDSQNGVCKEITYGGCLGTKNLFEKEEECVAACVQSSK